MLRGGPRAIFRQFRCSSSKNRPPDFTAEAKRKEVLGGERNAAYMELTM